MRQKTVELSELSSKAGTFFKKHIYHVLAVLIILAWCAPYFTSGSRIEWGDFSFFAQAYEAIRSSLLEYHQFPWWNPWVAGGVPLYANPQMGVFSIQTIFVLLFGSALGLKIAVAVYTLAGYASMNLLLRKYFKVEYRLAILLSLIWLFCSFFVSHLPSHFTFVWYMLTPLYVYLALTVHNIRSGLILGLAFAVMALSAVHNPFFHIALISGAILAARFLVLLWKKERDYLRAYLLALVAAAGVFAVIAGHRVLLTIQNVQDFPREISDPAAHPFVSFLGPLLPFSSAHTLPFVAIPAPFGFGEVTATVGVFALMTLLLCILFVLYQTRGKWQPLVRQFRVPLVVFGAGLICLALGFGSLFPFSPYDILKHMPIFGNMRVSSRWFVFFDLAMLIFIGLVLTKLPKKSVYKFAAYSLLTLGVLELFVLNVGYQNDVLRHAIVQPQRDTSQDTFVQTSHFGSLLKLPNGKVLIDDGQMPHHYREYEATLFNTGVLQANDALVDLNTKPTPRCPLELGCDTILSGNAKVTFWSPNKMILERTGPGRIKLNMNNSSYFLINGVRNDYIRVAEPYKDFYIDQPDSVKTITITVKP